MSEWHVPDDALRAWAHGGGGMASAASVEVHLMTCGQCQDALAEIEDPALLAVDLEADWIGIRDRIEPQRLNLGGRALARLGLRETEAMLLSSAPALTAAWLGGAVAAVLFAVLASAWASGFGVVLFLILAPLLPVAGVAAAYGGEADPTHELTLAAPYSKIRLLLLRTGAVLAISAPLTILAGVPLPGPWWIAVIWLLPTLAFVLATLAAATFMAPVYAAGAIALFWLTATLPALIRREPLALFDATALMTYTAIAVVAGIVFATRVKHLATDWRIG